MDLSQSQLYTFIDTAFLNGRAVGEIARQLCDGGSDIIQLRAKDRSESQVLQLAEDILPVVSQAGIPLVINDFIQATHRVGAPFCHLGQEDFFDAGHRHVNELIPPGSTLRIGLSSHAPEQAQRAMAAGAAYLGVGPVFATTTKPEAKPATLDYVRWAADHVTIPWFAIGGINLLNLETVVAAGARRICVVSAILNAPNMVRACQEFKRRLPSPSDFNKQPNQ